MADQVEQIRLEVEDNTAPAYDRANKGLEKHEANARRAQQAIESAGAVEVRVMDRSRSSVERLVASLEKKAAIAGKSGTERMGIERDQLIQRLAGEEKAIERVRVAYDKLIAAESKPAQSRFESFAQGVRNFVQHPLESASAAVEGFLMKLGPVGTIGLAAGAGLAFAGKQALDLVRHYGEAAEETENLAVRTGMSVKATMQYSAAAKLAHVDIESLQAGMRILSQTLDDTSDEGEKGRRILRGWGIEVRDVNGNLRPMEQIIRQIGERIASLPDIASQRNALSTFFGRGGGELLPFFRNMPALLERVGDSFDANLNRKLAETNEKIELAELKWEKFKKSIAGKVAVVVDVILPDDAKKKEPGFLERFGSRTSKGLQPTLDIARQGWTIATEPGLGKDLITGSWDSWQRRNGGPASPAMPSSQAAESGVATFERKTREQQWKEYLRLGKDEVAIRERLKKAEEALSEAIKSKNLTAKDAALRSKEAAEKELQALAKLKTATEQAGNAYAELRKKTAERVARGDVVAGVPLNADVGAGNGSDWRLGEERRKLHADLAIISAEREDYQRKYGLNAEARGQFWAQEQASFEKFQEAVKKRRDELDEDLRKVDQGNIEYLRQHPFEAPPGLVKKPRTELNEDLRKVAGIEIGAAPAGYVSPEKEVALLRTREQHEARILELRAGPGGERAAAEQVYQLRQKYAEREYAAELRLAALKGDKAERAKAEMLANDDYLRKLEEASFQREEEMLSLERRRFDSLKSSFEGIFDALLTKSRTTLGDIGNIFKAAVLTPIKEAAASTVASLVAPLFGGRAQTGGSGFSLGGLLGLGSGGGLFGSGAGGALGNPMIFSAAGQQAAPGGAGGMLSGIGSFLPGSGLGGLGGGGGLSLGKLSAGGIAPLGLLGSYLGMRGALSLGRSSNLAGKISSPIVGAASGMLGLGALTALFPSLAAAGPIGWIAAGGIGAAIGLMGIFTKSPEEKVKEKIKAVYGVEIKDKGILREIISIAQQSYGGNYDVAIRSQQVRDIVQLYSATIKSGQSNIWSDRTGAASLSQMNGTVYQNAFGVNGAANAYSSSLPALASGYSGDVSTFGPSSSGGGSQTINLVVDSEVVAQLVVRSGQVVSASGLAASKNRNAVRRLVLSPSTVSG